MPLSFADRIETLLILGFLKVNFIKWKETINDQYSKQKLSLE